MTTFQRLSGIAFTSILLSSIWAPVSAQGDPGLATRLLVLEARLDVESLKLNNRLNTLQADADRQKQEILEERSINKVQVDLLKFQVVTLTAKVQGLSEEVAALKGQKPGEPGKEPAKPADGQVLSLRAPFTIKDASGRVIFKVDAAGNLPRATIGNPAGGRVEIGLATGGGSLVGLYDDANKLLSTLVADPKGSYLRVRDNEQSTNLGKVEGDGVGLFLRKEDRLFGEVSALKGGYGIARVFGADGKSVGGLFAAAEGGGLALTGPGGGKSAVSLGVTPSGGKVRVFPVGGGPARAELVAEGNIGALNVFGSTGTNAVTVASVESRAGKIEITNSSGNVVVQAGQQANGRGMVTTGPFEGGLAGGMGGGLTPASTIVGQLKGK
jgi:hypothetical protein